MMLRCSMLEQIGLFDETFFLYFEEVELCLRASDHGWKAVNCLKAVVQHEEHAIPPKLKPYFIESVLLLARRRKNARIQSILRAACMTRGRPSCIRGLLRGLTKPLQLFPVAAVL